MVNKREREYIKIRNKLNSIHCKLNELDLQIFNENSELNNLNKKIKKELITISKNIEELKNPFLLFIIGPGKYGKTTLINSLIKEKILETKDIPNTWKLDVIIQSYQERMEILLENETKLSLSLNEGLNYLKEEEMRYNESKLKIKEEFNRYKKLNKKDINALKEYKEVLNQNYLYNSKVEESRYYIKKNGILDDFIIVDTPGLNQTLKSNTTKRMNEYYERADGVIWIVDAQNIVATCIKELIIQIKENYIIGENFNNIICVVNKMDTIRESDKEKVKTKINELYNNDFKDIVFVSSKYALNGYMNNDIESIKISNIKALKDSINKNFKSNSETVQIDAKYNLIRATINRINEYINSYKRQLYNDIYKYEEDTLMLNDNIVLLIEKLNVKIEKYLSLSNLLKKDVKKEVIILEEYINLEIKKIYKSNYIKSNDSVLVSISKSKYMIEFYTSIYKLESIENNNLYSKVIKPKKNLNHEWELRFKLEKFKSEVLEIINNKLLYVKSDIEFIIESSFRDKYTDYLLIKENIKIINNILKDINTWE